jgi:hypothetical protein
MAFAVATLATPPVAFAKDDLGPGCAPDRPAIAHYAGGVLAPTPKGEKAPIPCATATGFRTFEISIVVTNDGTILFQPALATETTGLPVGVLRSVDQGESWSFVDPLTTPARNSGADMNMWLDPETGRLFWSNSLGVTPEHIDLSDDEGMTWSSSSPVPMNYDHTQIFSGPPTISLKGLRHGYPAVLYVVVSGGYTCGAFGSPCGTHLSRSLDGGMTWGTGVAIPYPADCTSPGNNPIGGYGLKGVVGHDGTVYVPFTPCETPYVAISPDEGSTWELSLVANTETVGWGELGLGMDRKGNLYATWIRATDRLLYLSISTDRGSHWSEPLMIAAPGVNEAVEPQLVVGATGQVAVSYYGSKNAPLPFPPPCIIGSPTGNLGFGYLSEGASLGCPAYASETWDTYMTETFNALDRQPLFWSATLNDPADSTWYGISPSALRIPEPPPGVTGGINDEYPGGATAEANGSGRADYFAITMAPDDTPWVGFVQECPYGLPVLGNPNCPSTLTGTNSDGLFGFVGRLVRVRGERDKH